LRTGRVRRGGIEATRLEVLVSKEERYAPEEMAERLEQGGLADRPRERAVAAVEALRRGEATVHRTNRPHFHEVGGIDALVDIAGTMLALELLDVAEAICPVVVVGSGTVVRSEHGVLPAAPGPAASAILREGGFPVRFVEAAHELVTPTGAAILAAVARPGVATIVPEREGYGAGKHDPEGRPNALRILFGETEAASSRMGTRAISLLEANIDDMPAELLAHARDQLLAEGALDAWLEPIGMKKGRAGTKLCALVPSGDEARFAGTFLRETTTLGVRTTAYQRFEAEREVRDVTTSLGPVRVKVSRFGSAERSKPEFEDVRRIAEARGEPAIEVMRQLERELDDA
jgi:uncharacterized protein (TIGR00299 family) protein